MNNSGSHSENCKNRTESTLAAAGSRVVGTHQKIAESDLRGLECFPQLFSLARRTSRLASHRARIAELLGLNRSQVKVKAKTSEKVGPIGRQKTINAEVVVLIERS